jgi:hypothetical protein
VWSDIDLKVVVADDVLARYFPTADWLAPFGTLLGAERHDGPLTKTLRVSLVGALPDEVVEQAPAINRRLDLVFATESTLDDPALWDQGFVRHDCAVLWSRLPGDLRLADRQRPDPPGEAPVVGDVEPAGIAEMVDAFWFKAVVAIGKVMRDDLLIGGHLALDLARDCLVLEMMRRDRALGTTVHRTGGWGNDVIWDVWPSAALATPGGDGARAILDLVERCSAAFDGLVTQLAPGTRPRAGLLQPTIDAARAQLDDDTA